MTVLKPTLRLIVQFISLSSQKFDDDQDANALMGEPRKYRVVQAAQGRQMCVFKQELRALMFGSVTVLPAAGNTLAMRALMFRMLSRSAGAAHQLIELAHRGCPYRLFKALDGGAYEASCIPECMPDGFTRALLEEYQTYDALQEDEAQHVMSSIAHFMSLDILDIEARHSAARRILTLRSVQTWRMSMSHLNAEWTCRIVILREPWTPVQQATESRTKRRRRATAAAVRKDGTAAKKRGCKTGGGGPWRAFMHIHARGQKPSGALARGLSRRYALLRARNGRRYSTWASWPL